VALNDPALHGGAYLCNEHELRITSRCLREDLELSEDATFAEALAHPIVPTFRQRRSRVTAGGETVGSMHAPRPLHLIRHRHDHRALTWWDEDERIVWLCAYGFHRSEQPDDAYSLFHELIERGDAAYPAEEDYARAFRDRQRRFIDLARREAPELVARARARPGRSVTARLARTLDVRIHCVAGADVDELYIAFPCEGLDHQRIVFILRAVKRGLTATDWEWGVAFPTNDLTGSEMSFLLIVARDQ